MLCACINGCFFLTCYLTVHGIIHCWLSKLPRYTLSQMTFDTWVELRASEYCATTATDLPSNTLAFHQLTVSFWWYTPRALALWHKAGVGEHLGTVFCWDPDLSLAEIDLLNCSTQPLAQPNVAGYILDGKIGTNVQKICTFHIFNGTNLAS